MFQRTFALALLALYGASTARAQDCACGAIHPSPYSPVSLAPAGSISHGGIGTTAANPPIGSLSWDSGMLPSIANPVIAGTAADPGPVFPYSYYSAAPRPARVYVPHDNSYNDFPFGGQPYGHVYDRWGWDAMGTGTSSGLAHYFYAPVR